VSQGPPALGAFWEKIVSTFLNLTYN